MPHDFARCRDLNPSVKTRFHVKAPCRALPSGRRHAATVQVHSVLCPRNSRGRRA